MSRVDSTESIAITVTLTAAFPKARTVSPPLNFALTLPEAQMVPCHCWLKVEALSVAGRVTVLVEAELLPGLVWEMS